MSSSRLLFGGFAHHDGEVRERFQDAGAAAAGPGMEALQDERLADVGLFDHEIVYVEIVVVLGIRDGALKALAHVAGDALPRELEVGERSRDLLAADELGDEVELLRAD